MSKLLALTTALTMLAAAFSAPAAELKEGMHVPTVLVTVNLDGGIIALTNDRCEQSAAISVPFPFYAYATDKDGETHEGCWALPNEEGMPPDTDKAKIIRIVNVWFDGVVVPLPRDAFVDYAAIVEELPVERTN